MKKIGVLALQGDFNAHRIALMRVGVAAQLICEASQLADIDGLIVPGGESTSLLKLLHFDNMIKPLIKFSQEKSIFGTCAGAILLATHVANPEQECFAVIDIDIERNGYGRQNESCITEIDLEPKFYGKNGENKIEAVFIRAPIIHRAGVQVNVLARYKGMPVLVEQGKHLAATFHPELTLDPYVHSLFLAKV